MRLIDADALLGKSWDADTRCGYVQVVDVGEIENAPTIEVEPIVCCEDCKWLWKHIEADTHKVNLTMYKCTKGHNPNTENFYCGDGERKAEVEK